MSWNGDPLGYQIWYGRLAQIQQDSENYQQLTVTYPTTNVELTNLLHDNYYEVKVNAFNGKGHGPFSTPVDIYVGEAGKHCIIKAISNQAVTILIVQGILLRLGRLFY